jgi:DNA primase
MTPAVNVQFVEAHLKIESRQGSEYNVCCPIHDEKHASMRINVDKGVFFCHGCKARGGMAKLAKYLGVSYRYNKAEAGMAQLMNKLDLLRKGAQVEADVVLPEATLKRYSLGQTDYWTAPRPHGRAFNPETVEAFDLGYDPMTESAIIPIRNMWGELLGVTRRSLRKNSNIKYRDPRGFKKGNHLFGSWFAAQAESPTVVVTEGPLDCIKVWQAGHPAVAVYGSRVTEKQIMLLRRIGIVSIVFMFDNDTYGEKAIKQCKGFSEDTDGKWHYNPATDLRKFFVLKRVSYKGVRAKDPGDMTDSQIDNAVTKAKIVLR